MLIDLAEPQFALRLARISDAMADMPTGQNWLSPSEQTRLQAMRHSGRREEFLLGRWLLRTLFARSFGGDPATWPFAEQPQRPPVSVRHSPFGYVSISHGGGFVAAAAAVSPIGVDVESATRRLPAEVFEPLFGRSGMTDLERLQHWVVTEAFLKQQILPAHTDTIRRNALQPAPVNRARVRVQLTDDYIFAIAGAPDVLSAASFAAWPGYGPVGSGQS
ncbi:hypothetical protein C7S18_11225 [Ahniella affigens]|uniref:4'-phosphopantetheinyl transferase domain-containing protein n=1 Tax=Ahniella affigens TaxID=2021234 RepID=A0A2P1PSC4_9GAMM|nr:hypothetical protein [Ahniella affigens]AVP97735.1 hypothetical protein C7S18_11225 [Ahniella affigens]